MNDLEILSLELNSMQVGQHYKLSARALGEIGWNSMEYGSGREGLKRALRAKLIGSAYGSFEFVDELATNAMTIVRKEEGARVFTRDGDPMPDIVRAIADTVRRMKQTGKSPALIIFSSGGYQRFKVSTEFMLTVKSDQPRRYPQSFIGIPLIEDDYYSGHCAGAEYQMLSADEARAYYATKPPSHGSPRPR